MAGVNEVMQVWEDAIARWRAGDDRLPAPLDAWRASYQGRGTGIVDLEAIPEPYLGSWSEARAAVLALNPGQVLQGFQHRGGVFDREIGEKGSYAAWAATWPFVRPPWTDHFPPVRHITSRLRFLRDWFDDSELPFEAMLAVELYPWHSTKITAPIRPDPWVIREFVLEPLADSDMREVFAFGAPWFSILTDHLGLEVVEQLGAGGREYGSRVESRAVLVCQGPKRLRIVAEKHSGSAVPPATDETRLLRNVIDHYDSPELSAARQT